MKMLPAFYQAHLQSQLSRVEYLLLTCRRRKLQRFLDIPQLTFEKLWFPIFKRWLNAEFEPTQVLHIAIDRTSWGSINLLMVSLIVDKRALPIYGELLAKLGSSNLAEQSYSTQPSVVPT